MQAHGGGHPNEARPGIHPDTAREVEVRVRREDEGFLSLDLFHGENEIGSPPNPDQRCEQLAQSKRAAHPARRSSNAENRLGPNARVKRCASWKDAHYDVGEVRFGDRNEGE